MWKRIVAIAVLLSAAAGCGVPAGPQSFEAIDDQDVPNRLADTTTTTTTTTSTTTTTLPDTPESTTTTTIAPATQLVDVFFVSRDQLRPLELVAPSPVTDADLILLLEDGPGPSAPLLTNFIEEGLIIDTRAERGILTVDLDEEILDDIPSRDQPEAIAQIVLTFLLETPGVGSAVFTFDGSEENVPVPTGDGLLTNEPVVVDDYASIRADLELTTDLDPTATVPTAESPTITTVDESNTATSSSDPDAN
jgi:hypothetical protein